jgi:hypothetical protein
VLEDLRMFRTRDFNTSLTKRANWENRSQICTKFHVGYYTINLYLHVRILCLVVLNEEVTNIDRERGPCLLSATWIALSRCLSVAGTALG